MSNRSDSDDPDETRRKAVARVDRMARLAGGVAHVFNNILHAIQVNASLLAEATEPDDREALAREIQLASDRAVNVTKKMLFVSRRDVNVENVDDVSRELAELERFLWLPGSEQLEAMKTASATERPIRVLVVDDEEITRRTTVRALRAFKFEVTDVSSGKDAMRVLSESREFDIVVTDMVMPGMSGRELVGNLRPLHPDLPVVLLSGYSTEIVAKDFLREHGVAFAQKPIGAAALAETIRRVHLEVARISRPFR